MPAGRRFTAGTFGNNVRVRLQRTLLAVVVIAALAGCDPNGLVPPGPPASAGPSAAAPSRALNQLTVVTTRLSMAGYSRAKFHIWAEQGGGCNTRDVVLKRDGQGVEASSTCKIYHGTWISPYNGRTYTNPQQLDIDHLVPLANAWGSGARNWSDAQREQFANDLTRPQLLAVDLTDNRSKGDQDPSQWKPPSRAFWCTYASDWITVKAYWHLTVTTVEKAALVDMLEACP